MRANALPGERGKYRGIHRESRIAILRPAAPGAHRAGPPPARQRADRGRGLWYFATGLFGGLAVIAVTVVGFHRATGELPAGVPPLPDAPAAACTDCTPVPNWPGDVNQGDDGQPVDDRAAAAQRPSRDRPPAGPGSSPTIQTSTMPAPAAAAAPLPVPMATPTACPPPLPIPPVAPKVTKKPRPSKPPKAPRILTGSPSSPATPAP